MTAREGRHGPRAVDAALVAQLAAGRLQADAALAAGCSLSTVERRLRDEAFRQRVEQARTALFAATAARLVGAAVDAVERLAELAQAAESESVQLAACRSILQLAPAWRSAVHVEPLLDELRADLAALKEGDHR